MSWGGGEFSGEQSIDSDFTTPAGHQGVTFTRQHGGRRHARRLSGLLAECRRGRRHLALDRHERRLPRRKRLDARTGGAAASASSNRSPATRSAKSTALSSTHRTVPDVAMDADPNTGVYVLDSFSGGWFQVGGTSLASPMCAGLVAIADQGRALKASQPRPSQRKLLSSLYSLPASDFHDMTTGGNGTYNGETRLRSGHRPRHADRQSAGPGAGRLLRRRRHRLRRASAVRRRSTSMRIRLSSFQPPTATPSPSPTPRPVPAPSIR